MIEQTQAEIDFSAKLEKRMKAIDESDDSPAVELKIFDLSEELEFLKSSATLIFESLKSVDEKSLLPEQLQKIAAVSGGFKPADIISNYSLSITENQQALSRLGSFCLVETHGSEVFWTLKQAQRTVILAELLQDKNRFRALLDEPLPETDEFGVMLRAILKQNRINLETLDNKRLLAISSVSEALKDTREDLNKYDEAFFLPTVEEIRPYIQKTNFLSEYDVLLANGFYGRVNELTELDNFLLTPRPPNYPYWNGLVLTGIGGAGKTTLLAKFIRDAVEEKKATVAVLDFDRPGIDPHDFYWLEAEISRQVGQQYSEITEDLRAERRLARQDKFNVEQVYSSSDFESQSNNRSSSLLSDIQDKISSVVAATDKPFLLILDTFEEAAQQGFTNRICSWLDGFCQLFSPIPLKVVFSGRLFDYQNNYPILSEFYEIKIGEFDSYLAEEFLEKLGVNPMMAARIAVSEVIPRRPLELKLLAKMILENTTEDIEKLENEIREGGPLAKEFFAGIIYRRILLRIKDDTIREFAYPGLTLRFLTKDLIQKVLVPTLDIQPLTDSEANVALEKLANYGWLTYQSENGEIWHRKDLRRSMLKAMLNEQADVCTRISQSAVEFFKDGGERELAEATYHRLMQIKTPPEGETIEPSELMNAKEYIGADVADLPPVAAAIMRFVTEKKVILDEIELLPKRYLTDAYQDAGNNLYIGREFQKAYRLLKRGKESGIAHRKDNFGNLPHWEALTLYATAEWAELIKAKKFDSLRGNPDSITNLVKILFPAVIIEPLSFSTSEIEEMLVVVDRHKGLHIGNTLDAELTANVSRLAMCLIIANNQVSFSERSRKLIKFILEQIYYLNAPSLSVSLRKKLSFLERIVGNGNEFDASLSFTTLRLDLNWLSSLLDLSERFNFDSEMRNLIIEIRNTLEKKLNAPHPRTVSKLLNSIDSMKRKESSWQKNRVAFNPRKVGSKVFLSFFRSSDPEFRDPCRYALLEAFPDRNSYQALGEIFASVIKLDLDDLKAENFADALSGNPEHALESYVELVDRQWKLGELLKLAFQLKPKSEKLRRVLVAYEGWDKAVRAACRK
jgi:hypothetical protein